jgi:hypothetical protein
MTDKAAQKKKVVIVSIMMQSTNQKANALESIIGIFLHSCRTPEKVIETLARMGVSISLDAIHKSINSLSAESHRTLQELGLTFLASYAYDNFDVDLKSSMPMAEKSTESLKHLTLGLLFPLQHGVTHEDLRCLEELWRKSQLNPLAKLADVPPTRTWKDLLTLHPKSPALSNSELTRHDRFNSWKFLHDLCNYGPVYF